MSTATLRRVAAAFAVTGLITMPLAACSGGVNYDAERARVNSEHSSYMRGKPSPTRVTGPAPYTPPTTATSSAAPQAQQQPGKKSGIPTWVWILGGGAVLAVGYRFLQGQGGQPPAHAAYGSAPVPPVLDYPDYDDYDDDEPGPVAPAPPAPPVPPAAPVAPPSGGSSSSGDLWGA